MKLINRQIKAVEETLEQVIEEFERGKEKHDWSMDECIVCKEFYDDGYETTIPCCYCPVACWERAYGKECSCLPWSRLNPTFEEIAGFLKSLLVSLEEMVAGR